MGKRQTRHDESSRRILAAGVWESLAELHQALDLDAGLELVDDAAAPHDVVLLAVDGVSDLERQLPRIRELTPAPVVVVTSSEEPDLLERAVAVRAADLVHVDASLPQGAYESVSFAVRKAMLVPQAVAGEAAKHGRVVTVFSPKGGTGKSVTATNVAAYLSHVQGKRVLLLDLDVQFGDVAIMLGLEPEKTLYDVVTAPGELDVEKLTAFTLRHHSGVDVLAAPQRPEEADLVSEDKVARLLDVALDVYDVVVVDTSPYFHGPMLSALDRTDRLVLVSGPDIPTLKNLRLALQTLDLLSFPTERIRVLLNLVGTKGGITSAEVEAALSLPAHFQLPYDPAIPKAVNRGTAAILSGAGSAFSAALEAMAGELVPDTATPAAPAIRARRPRQSLARLVVQGVRSHS